MELAIHPDDAKDKVLAGIIRSLLRSGNVPASPKELSAFIIHWNLTKLSGETPQATVSSRISQHFKRCAEANPKRRPILGTWSGQGSRKLRYFIDRPVNIPVPEPSVERLSQSIEMVKGVPHLLETKKRAGA
jgi:hypothetical protein